MRRKRILAYITEDSERKASFKKRKKSLMKKAEELSVLCDVKVCAIVCSPFPEMETEVYPRDRDRVRELYARFKAMPELDQTRKKYSQEKIVAERIEKLETKVLKVAHQNREKEMTEAMFQCLAGQPISPAITTNLVALNDLAWVTKRHLQEITDRLGALVQEANSTLNPPPLASMAQAHAHAQTQARMQSYQFQGNGIIGDDMLTPVLPNYHLNMQFSNGMWLPANNRPDQGQAGTSNNP